jgi:hypothetical protein
VKILTIKITYKISRPNMLGAVTISLKYSKAISRGSEKLINSSAVLNNETDFGMTL